jgi:hypothetical protein
MPKTCLNCKAVALKDVPILSCGACRSAVVYCCKTCQKKDWKEHKKICKSLNIGEGAMQVQYPAHVKNAAKLDEIYDETELNRDEDGKRFFKLFTESTFKGSQAATRKMKKIVVRETTRHSRKVLLLRSLYLLVHTKSEKLLWPNSPLLVLLQFVDPNMLTGPYHERLQEGETRTTLLQHLVILADPKSSDYSSQENQLTLGRQLLEHGANVNTAALPDGDTPLHLACNSEAPTNLDFIQLLLENGANPNAQDQKGVTPLMRTPLFAPGAAKFMLEWPTTDVNITARSGASFLAVVREAVAYVSNTFSDQVALPDNPDWWVKDKFVLQQWREIEEMLVERGGHDTGIADLE